MKYFIRFDFRLGVEKADQKTVERHLEYLKEMSKHVELLGGTFNESPGGLILLKAENRETADNYCKNDPVIASGYYGYKLVEWNVLIRSKTFS